MAAVVARAILAIVASSPPIPAQEVRVRPPIAAVKVLPEVVALNGEHQLAPMVPPVERVLRRIRARTAGDPLLGPLATSPIDRGEDPQELRLSIRAPLDSQIEIPTRVAGKSVQEPGSIAVSIICSEKKIGEDSGCGLHYGSVIWKTSKPHVFVIMYWLGGDVGLPDRLLAIVRAESAREGLDLLPGKEPDWPSATPSERLALLLPPDTGPVPPAAARPSNAVARSAGGAFASPRDVLAAADQASARHDWEASLRCRTPISLGLQFRMMLGLVSEHGFAKLARTIEGHLKFPVFDAEYGLIDSKELRDILVPPGGIVRVDRPSGAQLYEAVQRRVGDVPKFLADCVRQFPADALPQEDRSAGPACEGIRIEGDKASGYYPHRRPAPDLKDLEWNRPSSYLPRYVSMHFRRINGSWLIAEEADDGH